MRIVTFTSDRIVDYSPYGGVEQFGRTELVGGDIVGEYFGESTVGELPNYGGTWPIPVPISYKSEFLPLEFLRQMASAEIALLVADTNTTLKNYVEVRLQMKDLMIEPTDPAFIAFVGEMLVEGVVTLGRHDILILGVPVNA